MEYSFLIKYYFKCTQIIAMLVSVYGASVFGVEANLITIEVNIGKGIGYHLVGLPDNAVKESNFRIAAALNNIGYKLPGKKITINMAPADVRKEGSAYDLPLAIGILAASKQIQAPNLERYLIMGELALNGGIRPIKGALPLAIQALKEGFIGFTLPKENALEAAIVKGLKVYGVTHLEEVIDFFKEKNNLEPAIVDTRSEFKKQLKYPEFKRGALEVMRQPLEDREVTIARAKFTVTYPASFMFVASMNPSPSGFFTDPNSKLGPSAFEMQRYMSKISGPLLDRIDLHIEVEPVPFKQLAEKKESESSTLIRAQVTAAHERQSERFKAHSNTHYNAQMTSRQIRVYCALDQNSATLLRQAMERLSLSARAYDRILKVARTIADLAGKEKINAAHIAEAIQYRSLDREGWMG